MADQSSVSAGVGSEQSGPKPTIGDFLKDFQPGEGYLAEHPYATNREVLPLFDARWADSKILDTAKDVFLQGQGVEPKKLVAPPPDTVFGVPRELIFAEAGKLRVVTWTHLGSHVTVEQSRINAYIKYVFDVEQLEEVLRIMGDESVEYGQTYALYNEKGIYLAGRGPADPPGHVNMAPPSVKKDTTGLSSGALHGIHRSSSPSLSAGG